MNGVLVSANSASRSALARLRRSRVPHEDYQCSSRKISLRTHFCAISAGGNAQKSIEQAGGRVEVFGLRDSIPSLWTIIKLVQYFRRVQPDVIHCHGAEANFHGILAAYLAGVKVRVAEEIGIPEHSWIATVIFRGVYAISTRCVAVA